MEISHVFQFGGTPAETNELAQKVLTGIKTATSSLYDCYLNNSKKMSRIGEYASVRDFGGNEICIVRISKIEKVRFGDISEIFAIEEGDGNLENWLSIHNAHYSAQLEKIGKKLSDDTVLVCEWFGVI